MNHQNNLKKPNALENIRQILEQNHIDQISLFLDYDGTLTPIIKNPSRAFISKEMLNMVKKLSHSKYFQVAIVTGRKLETILDFVNLDSVIYAGNHGFKISSFSFEKNNPKILLSVADEYLEHLNVFYKKIKLKLNQINGILIENNTFSITIHYRNLTESFENGHSNNTNQISYIEKEIDFLIADQFKGKLIKTLGKKVFEIRPNFDWNKGKAVQWILDNTFSINEDINSKRHIALYLGDDVTDEDAFEVLLQRKNGIGVVVSEDEYRKSKAEYRLNDTNEVLLFLELIYGYFESRKY